MKKVLVTGASGFVGRQVVEALKHLDCNIHAITCKQSMPNEERVHFYSVNLFDRDAVASLLETIRPTHLLHFAWITTPGKYLSALENIDWVEASLHLIRCFAKSGGTRAVFAGSCIEYEWKHALYSESKTPFHSTHLYGSAKRALYIMAETLCQQLGVSFAWGYIFHLFGPFEHPDRFVPFLIRGLLKGQQIPLSHSEQIRDYLDVRELSLAFLELMDSPFTGAINLGSGERRTLKSIALAIANKIGNPQNLQFGKLPPRPEPIELIPDLSLQTSNLSWKPHRSFEQSIEEVIEWWKNQS